MSPLEWERPLFELHAQLETDADAVSDAKAEAVVEMIDLRLATNCDSAAQYLFFAIAPICASKPHLTAPLLTRAVQPLYQLGVETVTDAISWLRYFLEKDNPYVVPSESGRAWMRQLLDNPMPLQVALMKVMIEDTLPF